MDLTFERGTEDDAGALSQLYLSARRAAHGIPPLIHDDESVNAWMACHVLAATEVWIARLAGDATSVGFLAIEGHQLDQLYVDPDLTGRGIGSSLLSLAKKKRPDGLSLWTFTANAGARRFYERHGFVPVRATSGDNEEQAPDVLYRWPGSG